MLRRIDFHNFRCFRNCSLPLDRFTVLVGPNGSGKSSVLAVLSLLASRCGAPVPPMVPTVVDRQRVHEVRSLSAAEEELTEVRFLARVEPHGSSDMTVSLQWRPSDASLQLLERAELPGGAGPAGAIPAAFGAWARRVRVYRIQPSVAGRPATIGPPTDLAFDAANLASVIDRLHDEFSDRFAALNGAIRRWFPEYDELVLLSPEPGKKQIALRPRGSRHPLPGHLLSDGTLFGLCLLTLANLPDPPSFVALEDPAAAMHPRLLEEVHDALVRLAYPEECADPHAPVQVLVTTHSPYFLDLFTERPEQM